MFTTLLALTLTATPAAASPMTASSAQPPTAVVICPDALRPALAPWLKHRESQGYAIRVLPSQGTANSLRGQIRQEAAHANVRFVVLVGDVDPAAKTGAAGPAPGVPTFMHKAKVNIYFGGGKDIASDNDYGDLDGDGAPELAVGRLSADTPDELGRIVAKILAYERGGGSGTWRRRLNFVIGLGRFGPIIDAALETATRHLLTTTIPAAYDVSATLANWQSPYCPDPLRFRQSTIDRLNEGSSVWIYIGHGKSSRLDKIRVPGGQLPIFEAPDVARLKARWMPIALFLACSTGEFDIAEDCLAERMVRQPGGPVAAMAGSQVTMPYGMGILGLEMIEEYFGRRPGTLGALFLAAKRGMARSGPGSQTRQMLDTMGRIVSPPIVDLAEERREHLSLFNLLGDPMLRLTHPNVVRLDVPESIESGETLPVTIHNGVAGRATVELIWPRGQLGFVPPARDEYPRSKQALAAFQNVYRRANDGRIASVQKDVPVGTSRIDLLVPQSAAGRLHLRVYIEGAADSALGWAPIHVVPKAKQAGL